MIRPRDLQLLHVTTIDLRKRRIFQPARIAAIRRPFLREKTLVDRPTVKQKVIATASEDAWLTMMAGFRRLCDLADQKTTEPSKYYDAD
ncbi:MAG TPA: hypothetical protein VFZ34_22225 [Blastocatellia bacterium]|nr:hypothetical protein [Blastocatellia bacterium]